MPTALIQFVAATLSAAAIALFARAEWPWLVLGFVALVPWLAALDRIATMRGALAAGLLMCEAYVLALFHWLPSAMHGFSGLSWSWGLLALVIFAPLIAPQFLALALARQFAQRAGSLGRLPLVPLTSTLAYVGADWAIPKLMADTLGLPLFGSALLRQGADVAGVLGLTLLLLLANECALTLMRRGLSRPRELKGMTAPAAVLAGLVIVPMIYGAVRLQQFSGQGATAAPVRAALVQGGFSHYDRAVAEFGAYLTVRTVLDTHIAVSRSALELHDVDFLIWPETVYPLTFGQPLSEEAAEFDRRLAEFTARTGMPLIFGAYEADTGRQYNVAVFLQPSAEGGARAETYRKTRLFPLTEQVPAVLDYDFTRQLMPWLGTWSRGTGARVISIVLAGGRTLRVTPLICYDALTPALASAGVRDGAEMLVTISNDSRFPYGNAQRLLLVISAFRSIETRRPQFRVANTGISAVITPTGEILDQLEPGARDVLVGSLHPADDTTLFLLAGQWLGPASLAVSALVLLGAVVRRGRSEGADNQA